MLADLQQNDGAYRLLLLLHILSAIVGLGAVMLNGLYAAQAQKHQGPGGRAISESNLFVSSIAEYAIYLIFVFGVILVIAGPWDFDETWVWLAMLLFIIDMGVSHGVMFPGHKKLNALLAEMEQGPAPAGGPPPQAVQVEAIGKRLAAGGAFLNLSVVVFLFLMIWKPGA